jgi:hypothetical protein
MVKIKYFKFFICLVLKININTKSYRFSWWC